MSTPSAGPSAGFAEGTMSQVVVPSASLSATGRVGRPTSSSLLSPPVLAAVGLARRAVVWWLEELAGMVPRRLADAWKGRGEPATVLLLTREAATLLLPARGRSGAVTVALADVSEEPLRARVNAVLRDRHLSNAATVRLDPVFVHEAEVTLPAAAEPALGQVMQHQIERLVPLPAKDVVFARRVAARAPDGKSIKVRVVMTRRTTIDRALQVARAAGLIPKLVIVGDSDADRGTAAAVFWRAERRQASRYPRLLRLLEALIVVLALAEYGLHVDRLDRIRSALEAEVARARQEATSVQAKAETLAQASEALDFFEARRHEIPPLRIIEELTRLIPKDSWINQLSLRGRTIELTGFAPRATELIPRLEASALFEKPQFRSAITLSPDGRSERFSVALAIKPDRVAP